MRRQPAQHPPRGGSLLDQAVAANQALFEHAVQHRPPRASRPACWAASTCAPASLALVNAGHVSPYLCRAGAVTPVQLPVNLPLGMFPDTVYRSTDLDLEPGDRLVLVTDGMLERNAATLDLIAEISSTRPCTRGRPPAA